MVRPGRVVLLALLAILPVAFPPALADGFSPAPGSFPTPRDNMGKVWTGADAYLFGGIDGWTAKSEVIRWRPGEEPVVVATLPAPRALQPTAWDGRYAWLFGGWVSGGRWADEILRFDPATNTIATMTARMPPYAYGGAAFWDGHHAWILGMNDRAVHRYDPSTDTLTTYPGRFAAKFYLGALVWTGSLAYYFGGWTDSPNGPSPVVYTFDPATLATGVAAHLPTGRFDLAAVPDESHIYLFGGAESGGRVREVLRFDTTTHQYSAMAAQMDPPRSGHAAFYAENRFWILGGRGGGAPIEGYDLAPGAPSGVTTKTGPGRGEITVQWSPPASNSHRHPIDAYQVFVGETAHATLSASTRSLVVGGFGDGETASFSVSASNADGAGPASAPVPGVTARLPSEPRNLRTGVWVAKSGEPAVSLTWIPPADHGGLPLAGYRIYRGSSVDNLHLLAEVGAGSTIFDDATCRLATVCVYRVAAFHAVGESGLSNAASGTGFKLL